MLLVVFVKKQFYNTGCTTSLFIPYTRNEYNSVNCSINSSWMTNTIVYFYVWSRTFESITGGSFEYTFSIFVVASHVA